MFIIFMESFCVLLCHLFLVMWSPYISLHLAKLAQILNLLSETFFLGVNESIRPFFTGPMKQGGQLSSKSRFWMSTS